MLEDVKRELAPTGILRAGINLSNGLLVTGKTASGDPVGVAPDMAIEIAKRLGIGVTYVTYPRPILLAGDALADKWDIGMIGAEPQRAEQINFTTAYVEIEATYLVPAGSTLKTQAEIDKPGNRIAVSQGSAYDLWLVRNIKHATLAHAPTVPAAFDKFVGEKLEVMAALKPQLLLDIAKLPGARIIEGHFATVQQAIGTPKKNSAGAKFLQDFVNETIRSGFVASLIAKHRVQGLSVASAA